MEKIIKENIRGLLLGGFAFGLFFTFSNLPFLNIVFDRKLAIFSGYFVFLFFVKVSWKYVLLLGLFFLTVSSVFLLIGFDLVADKIATIAYLGLLAASLKAVFSN